MDQGDRVWHIGVRATDNGQPPLSDSALLEINVIVPRLKDLVVSKETNAISGVVLLQAAISIETITNLYYWLQSKDRLDDPVWSDRGTWEANNSQIRILDQENWSGDRKRFFRVQVLESWSH